MSGVHNDAAEDTEVHRRKFSSMPAMPTSVVPDRSLRSRNSIHEQAQHGVFRERVLVRVYDLGQASLTRVYNGLARNYGAYHTGVQVYGREWSFGMSKTGGIAYNIPGQDLEHSFRETLSMGYTTLSPGQVIKLVHDMKIDWRGNTYNRLYKNCHNFSNEFCRRLGVAQLPSWVNELADTGAATADYLDSANSGYDGGAALFDMFHSVMDSVFSAFSYESETSSETENANNATEHQRLDVE